MDFGLVGTFLNNTIVLKGDVVSVILFTRYISKQLLPINQCRQLVLLYRINSFSSNMLSIGTWLDVGVDLQINRISCEMYGKNLITVKVFVCEVTYVA